MLQPRGRSRQVSNAALARQASEERRMLPILAPVPVKAGCHTPSFIHSSSPSPLSSASMSPDYYDLPASPPRSLEDQVHVAYALDDIHLAKVLLLRLKGIEVTSDDDPRIAAVQDEDFDFCFVPNGRLMDDTDEKAIKEMQIKELARLEERRRFERLRICEQIWDDQKRRMREERLAAFRHRERRWIQQEDRRRKTEQEHHQKRDQERTRIQKAAAAESQRTRARLVCYDNLPSTSEKRVSHPFVYDFMIPSTPCNSKLPGSRSPSVSHSRPRLRGPIFDDSRAVPFTAVLDSMQGPLFPNEDITPSLSRSASRTHSHAIRHRERQLLDALLLEVKRNEDDRRNIKGKQKAQLRRSFPCLACSVVSSPTSPLSTSNSRSISRTSSWLSFTGSSPSSSSTDLTTPPTSPVPSFSKPSWFTSRPKSWTNLANPSLRHSCNLHSRLTPVSSSESPLPLNPPHPPKSSPMSSPGQQRSTSTVRAAKEGAGLLVRRVSRFVELAKELHHTYVNLALSNSTELGFSETHISGDALDPNSRIGSKLRAPGCRVNQRDVMAFLSSSSSEVGPSPDECLDSRLSAVAASTGITFSNNSPKYIPLRSAFSYSEPPRTVLPDPLPYRLFFQPIPVPIRSPFRFHALSELHTMYPSASTDPSPLLKSSSSCDLYNLLSHQGPLTWRIRSVGNPAYLRLKALHNVIRNNGIVWEGRGRDTAIGGGRERIVGVAYDGVGRSSLSWEFKG